MDKRIKKEANYGLLKYVSKLVTASGCKSDISRFTAINEKDTLI